jgi:hypothetical protein
VKLGDWPRKFAGFDDDALAALANKGLVRRAGKDVSKSPPIVTGDDGDALQLDVGDQHVMLCLPPGDSTCSCDAGICRHILAALLFVRDAEVDASDAATSLNLREELISIDEEKVIAWAGKALLKKAALLLSGGVEIREDAAAIRITLPAAGVVVRYFGGGLDALLCDCHAAGPCEHKAAAALGFKAVQEGRPLDVEPATLREHAGAARTREQVRAATIDLLEEAVTLGLSRLSSAFVGRVGTLATSAHGVDLPRLERLLESLASRAKLILDRNALGDVGEFLEAAATCRALAVALERPGRSLVGEHRNVYLPLAGAIELVGVGATRWQTASGYHGLTLYFWEPAAKRWASWSDARPLDAPDFSPSGRARSEPPWTGARHPRDAAGSAWHVSGLRRSAAGRIAGGEAARGIRQPPQDLAAIVPIVTDFGSLSARSDTLALSSNWSPLDDLVLLQPTTCDEPAYDAVRQVATCKIHDAGGQAITLHAAHGPAAGDAIATLLATEDDPPELVLARRLLDHAEPAATPITFWRGGRPTHLTLDAAERRVHAKDEPVAAKASTLPVDTGVPCRIDLRLAVARGLLRDSAEAGTRVRLAEEGLAAAAKDLSASGLTAAAGGLTTFVRVARSARGGTDVAADRATAAALFDAVYLVQISCKARGSG